MICKIKLIINKKGTKTYVLVCVCTHNNLDLNVQKHQYTHLCKKYALAYVSQRDI